MGGDAQSEKAYGRDEQRADRSLEHWWSPRFVVSQQCGGDAEQERKAALEHVDFFRNRDSQISLSVIQDPCWGREASMDDATLS
jgi:hypothetical protein